MTRAFCVLLIALALVPSLVGASSSRFSFDGRVGTSLLLAEDQTRFELPVHAGDTVDAIVSWGSPATRLALDVERTCAAASFSCDVQAAQSDDACEAWGRGNATGTLRALRFVAPEDDVYVIVIAGIISPTPSTPFHLTLDADAATLAGLSGPFGAGGLHAERPWCAA